MRALVIEDDPHLRGQVTQMFSDEGFAVDQAADGENGLYMATEYPVDIAIVDLGLPGTSGIDIIRKARKAGRSFPILILTARDGWQSKVEGLEAGADDYLVKPFHREELLARARALLRRSGGWAQPQLTCGPVTVDTTAKTVTVNERPVELTAYEFKVLEYLILHAGEVVSKSTLTEHLYAEEDERDSNVIEVFIRRLRTKIDPDGTLAPITTLRGSGYRWDLPRS
ncbi:two-component system response regulator PhoP [Panacagrimonas perspica]|uniref:Two-component system response regulator PhoP n=1 Tax=Panacagrimonas perspica TaxID=381431 RepID=A0A4S3K8G4_9GAMM|nr:response regulator transcription factor [Panacagrimonas perspica]TDU32086.1 two-component system response regulator PhoP [Panacagrimonas perspica]THD04388.1 DNA-binding response regulator [Panacagrimonas perspica]